MPNNSALDLGFNLIKDLASYSNGYMYCKIQFGSLEVGYASLMEKCFESENPYLNVASKLQLSADFNTSASGPWGVEIVRFPYFL